MKNKFFDKTYPDSLKTLKGISLEEFLYGGSDYLRFASGQDRREKSQDYIDFDERFR